MVFLNDPYNVNKLISKDGSIVQWLSQKENIDGFFDSIGLFNRENELRIVVSSLIESFSKYNYDMLARYFKGEMSLKDVLYLVIDHIKESNSLSSLSSLSIPLLKTIFHNQETSIDNTISAQISNKFSTEEITLFGLGLADGSFENRILKNLGCSKSSIFGFDKNFLKTDSNIKYISGPNEIDRPINLFSARWVLHHLPKKERWNILKEWFSIMSKHSMCIIVEEGCLHFSDNKSQEFYFYEFILGIFDICSNIVFCSDWINLKKEEYRDKFFLEYLSLDDILEIRKLFDPKSKLKIIPSYSDYFVENIIFLER